MAGEIIIHCIMVVKAGSQEAITRFENGDHGLLTSDVVVRESGFHYFAYITAFSNRFRSERKRRKNVCRPDNRDFDGDRVAHP